MIKFIESADNPMWHGIMLAVGMFVASVFSSLLLNHYYFLMYRVGTRIQVDCQYIQPARIKCPKSQTVLTAAIYRKTLRLSSSARREKTVGEIVNLMAIDVDRFQQIAPATHQYWSTPFQVWVPVP